MNHRPVCAAVLIAILASILAGCVSSDDPRMAATLKISGDTDECNHRSIVNQSLDPKLNASRPSEADGDFVFRTSPGLFIKCMNEKGWNLVVASQGIPMLNVQWARQSSDMPGKQNPGGECKLTYDEHVREAIIIPTVRKRTVTGLLWVAGTWIKFSPEYYDLETPGVTRQSGYVALTFHPKAAIDPLPDLIMTIDPCTKNVVREVLRYET